MKFLKITLVSLLLVFSICETQARPVSYPEGWTVMQRNNGDFSSVHVHYSPTFKYSVGIYHEKNWEDDVNFTGVQVNRLLKRWNAPNSQANLYAKVAIGQADPFGEADAELGGFVEVAADWETRRWFTEYRFKASDNALDRNVHHSARVGVAPYIGDYGDLHTWMMVQVENHPEREEKIVTTPVLRFFKGVQLFELGYSIEQEEWMANWIVRF